MKCRTSIEIARSKVLSGNGNAQASVLETDARVDVAGAREIEKTRGQIDPGYGGEVCGLRQCKGQAAGSAANVEHALALREPGEADQQRSETPAPPAHEPLIR